MAGRPVARLGCAGRAPQVNGAQCMFVLRLFRWVYIGLVPPRAHRRANKTSPRPHARPAHADTPTRTLRFVVHDAFV